MTGKIITAALLAVLFVGTSAGARTLEEVLREKGVITEEDYREVMKSRPVSYRFGEGFTFLSSDEKFRLSLGFSMQFLYAYTDLDDNGAGPDSSQFRLRRVKLLTNGHAFTNDLTYKLVANFVEANSGKFLEETYLNYRFLDEAQLRLGQDKVPFGRQFLTPTTTLQFVDSSLVTVAFTPGYDTGLLANGKAGGGIFTYAAGIYGGTGQNKPRSGNDNAIVARVTVNPLGEMPLGEADLEQRATPLLSLGACYFRNTLKKNGAALEENNLNFASNPNGWLARNFNSWRFAANEKLDIDSFGIDAAFKWEGFSFQGEYFIAQADGRDSDATLLAQGFYAQAGYCLIPRSLEVAARYAYSDPNRDRLDDTQTEVTGAVSYYFSRHNLKLQADYTNIHKQEPKQGGSRPTDDGQVRLQAQLVF